jgi:hypothetical protein
MPQEKNKAEEYNKSQEANKSHGPQGIDKAPGEETSGDFENVVQDTQKAKNKVDGDPSKPEDQPNEE